MTELDETGTIRLFHHETARGVLDSLRDLSLERYHGKPHLDKWAWRGQADQAWELVPAAFRPGTWLGYTTTQCIRRAALADRSSDEFHQAEYFALYDFLHMADKLGLPIPGDSPLFRNQAAHRRIVRSVFGTAGWPPVEVLEVMAFAQHHGVPTRLLDFTRKAQIAAYFAAASSLNVATGAGRFAVWGVDREFLYMAGAHPPDDRITTVTVPRAANSYLHAQHGFFLIDTRSAFDRPIQLNRTIGRLAASAWLNGTIDRSWLPLVKIDAPISIAAEVLELLEVDGIDQAHLMPSFERVRLELERRRQRSIDRGELSTASAAQDAGENEPD